MKRRHMPRLINHRCGENWGDRIRRLYPKEVAAAALRMEREAFLYRWPTATRVKTTYRRRNR